MYKDDLTRLLIIRDTAQDTLSFIKHKTRADLDSDNLAADALTEAISRIGRAADHLTPDCRRQHPEVAWERLITASRRFLEDYDQVDLNEVWSIATEDLPVLAVEVEKIIPTLSETNGNEELIPAARN